MKFVLEWTLNVIFYAIRAQVLIVYFFFSARGYFFFVFFVLFGMLCDIEDSYLHLFSKCLVYLVVYTTFFLTLILNLFYFGKKVQFFIGNDFLQRYLPGPLKGLLPFALFLSTWSLLESVNTLSLLYSINDYEFSIKQFTNQINEAKTMDWGRDFLLKAESLESAIKDKLPAEYPSKGTLTLYTNRFVNLFKY